MARMKVNKIELNVEKMGKNGPFKTHKIVLMNVEKMTTKTEQVPAFLPAGGVIATLKEGDLVDAKYEQKGNFWNLVEIVKVEGAASSTEQSVIPSATTQQYQRGGGYKEDPDKQMSIARQNVSRTAMDFVTKLIEIGVYDKKKLVPDFAFAEVLRFAKRLEGYVLLKEDESKLEDAVNNLLQEAAASDNEEQEPF